MFVYVCVCAPVVAIPRYNNNRNEKMYTTFVIYILVEHKYTHIYSYIV